MKTNCLTRYTMDLMCRNSATVMHSGMKMIDFKIIKGIKKRRKHLGEKTSTFRLVT